MDKRYGRDTTIITKGKTTYELKDKDCPPDSLVKLCFSSDFFIEEADEWRDGCWDFIRRRLEAKERNIEFYFHQCGSMFLRDGENIGKWNLNEQIKRAEEIQNELEKLHR